MMSKFENYLIDDFLLEKEVNEGISEKTIKIYFTVFRLLYSSKHIIPSDLSTYTVQNFKRFLGENLLEKKWSSATYNFYRKNLSVFCRYLKNEGYLDNNPIEKISKRREPIQLPKSLTKIQISELFDNLENAFNKETFNGYRNIIIVYTYIYTGLRRSELLKLLLSDINIHEGYIRVEKGKGSKDRYIPITSKLSVILSKYLKVRNKNFIGYNCDYFFPTIYGNKLGNRDMTKIIKRLRYCLTFKFTWHQLRHTFATELVRNNLDIYNISQILGHSKIETTKIYLNSDTERLRKQLNKINLFS